MFITSLFLSIICSLRGIIASIRPLCPTHDNLRGIITSICLLCPARANLRGIITSICLLCPAPANLRGIIISICLLCPAPSSLRGITVSNASVMPQQSQPSKYHHFVAPQSAEKTNTRRIITKTDLALSKIRLSSSLLK